MEIDGITLWLFGGVAQFRGMFPGAGAEFRIAIAGPLVSLVLGTMAALGHSSAVLDQRRRSLEAAGEDVEITRVRVESGIP